MATSSISFGSLAARGERSHTGLAESSGLKGFRKKEPNLCISYVVIMHIIFRNIYQRTETSMAEGLQSAPNHSFETTGGEFDGNNVNRASPLDARLV